MILSFALNFAFFAFTLGLVFCAVLLWRGPGLADRILAVDTMVVNMIALILLYNIRTGNEFNFEAALLFALTGFVSTVAFAKFALRGDIIE